MLLPRKLKVQKSSSTNRYTSCNINFNFVSLSYIINAHVLRNIMKLMFVQVQAVKSAPKVKKCTYQKVDASSRKLMLLPWGFYYVDVNTQEEKEKQDQNHQIVLLQRKLIEQKS